MGESMSMPIQGILVNEDANLIKQASSTTDPYPNAIWFSYYLDFELEVSFYSPIAVEMILLICLDFPSSA
jgi:hypothetical protein